MRDKNLQEWMWEYWVEEWARYSAMTNADSYPEGWKRRVKDGGGGRKGRVGANQVVEGGRSGTDGLSGWNFSGGGDLKDGSSNPEKGGGYHGMGLVELVWEAVVVILNRRFTAYITYHDSFCGFRAGCGTGTATLEIKMLH